MIPKGPRLSLLTFPQRYDGTRIHLRVLVVPRLDIDWNGNPLLPLITDFPAAGDMTPAFADADLRLEARVITGFAHFPSSVPADFSAPLPEASGVRATARTLFEAMVAPGQGRFKLTDKPLVLAPDADPRYAIKKFLPRSYRDSFVFTGARTPGAVTDDSYHCAMKSDAKFNEKFALSDDTVSWGQVYAYCLRQPRLAIRVGLVREASFAVDDALFEKGGYLYVDLAADSAYAAQVATKYTFVSRYAARIPRLTGGAGRQLFAAVQFPVMFDDPLVPGPAVAIGKYDQVFIEAADYDDGFAKIVHGAQPVSQNLLSEEADDIAPVNDIGIRLGWDDEQILAWQNRQMTPDKSVPDKDSKPQRLDAPMGVFGYRIDARTSAADSWHSLVRVRPRAPLMLDDVRIDAPEDTDPGMELSVEVHPMQIDGNQTSGQFWLPAYMSQWTGRSLVLPDEDAAALYHTEQAGANLGRQYTPLALDDIPLRYGKSYQMRVRLMDPTGGGPTVGDAPIHESPSPVATVPFRRHVVPEPPRLADLATFPPPAPAAAGEPDAPFFTGNELRIGRPRLSYPSVVFTGGYADPIARLQAASDRSLDPDPASRDRVAFGIPDPNALHLRFDVEVRALRMDNKLSVNKREAWALLYTTTRDFDADFAVERVVPLTFRTANVLRFADPTDLGDMGLTVAQIDAMDELPLPKSRDVRITIRAIGNGDAGYWAPNAHIGKPMHVVVRRNATDERGLIADDSDARRIRALWLRPDAAVQDKAALAPLLFRRTTGDESPTIIERLSQNIDVTHNKLTLVGKPGERVAFACSRRIRHTLSPDSSSLTFAAKEDLSNHWVVAVTLRLDRDWTWEGLRHIGFQIFREGTADPGGRRQVGEWEIIQTASYQALMNPERAFTRLIFLDAVDPQTAPPRKDQPADVHFPDTIALTYSIEPRFPTPPLNVDPALSLSLSLPVTTAPVQVPRIVAAGLALSEYRRSAAYATSEPRRRYLWLELDHPPADINDAYFIRLLGYAPDLLLSDHRGETLVPPEEPPLAIDAEMTRLITPAQSDDSAGLSAMLPLTPGASERHFLVPLPPGLTPDSAEMFGMFTYELRVGHIGIWSTAQARFGRPLQSTGVQHPAPTLLCTAIRGDSGVIVEAPYALAVLNGKNITADPPRTQIWALLYAQVRQADDKDSRNVLLDDRRLILRPKVSERNPFTGAFLEAGGFENHDAQAHGATQWSTAEIVAMLLALGLPADSPLSVLCVEMMPTMASLVPQNSRRTNGFAAQDVVAQAFAAQAGGIGSSAVSDTTHDDQVRPLSDGLGHFRILRTSPLTAIPEVCCADC